MNIKQLLCVLLLALSLFGGSTLAQNPQYYLYHYPNKGGITFGRGMSAVPSFTGNKWQCIYYPSDFPKMPAGRVKNVYVKMFGRYFDSTSVYYRFTIRMGLTSKSGFTTGAGYDNFVPNLPLVFYADTLTIPLCDSDLCWLKIPLTEGDFTFSKGENFVVEFAMGGPWPINGFDLNWTTGTGTPPRRMGGHRDSTRSNIKAPGVADLGFDMLPTGLDEVHNIQSFGLFPNPAREGRFNVTFDASKPVRSVWVTVSDVTGRCVLRREYETTGASFFKEINLGGAVSGSYFVELEADGERIVRKLMIE